MWGMAVIGMGINIKKNKTAFEGELADVVGTLEDVAEVQLSRAQIAAEIAGQVLKIFEEDAKSPAAHKAIIK